jgi:hypothetical protein
LFFLSPCLLSLLEIQYIHTVLFSIYGFYMPIVFITLFYTSIICHISFCLPFLCRQRSMVCHVFSDSVWPAISTCSDVFFIRTPLGRTRDSARRCLFPSVTLCCRKVESSQIAKHRNDYLIRILTLNLDHIPIPIPIQARRDLFVLTTYDHISLSTGYIYMSLDRKNSPSSGS